MHKDISSAVILAEGSLQPIYQHVWHLEVISNWENSQAKEKQYH